MQVILMERIAKLGNMGEEVSVRPGYARNFLLPQKKAVRATEPNRQRFEAERANLEAANQERRAVAKERAGEMTGMAVVLIRQAGESGQLYGSVTARDIAESITEQGFAVRRQQVELAHPIKSLGIHSVAVALHPEVTETVTVNVARSLDEAEIQARSGRAVLGFDADDEDDDDFYQDAADVFEPEALEDAVEGMSAEEADGEAENTA